VLCPIYSRQPLFKTKDVTTTAADKRQKLLGIARQAAFGFGFSREKREEMLLAGIYLEMAALRDRLAPMSEEEAESEAATDTGNGWNISKQIANRVANSCPLRMPISLRYKERPR
jgi:hypothetical protein